MSKIRIPLLLIPGILLLFISMLFFQQCSQSENARFEAYTENLFRQEVQGNTISLHYTLKDPESFHIHETPLSFGNVSTDTDSMGTAAENALATLYTYDANQLSEENKLCYTLLERTFLSSRNLTKYALYEEPLSPLTGTQAQLPVLLSEYQFYSEDDVDIYLKLLKELPSYFEDIIDFETAKSNQGLFMTRTRAESVIQECEAFINMSENNYLHETFKTRLTALNLPQDDFDFYIKENNAMIDNYVYPAYETLKTQLNHLKDTGTNENGLCYLPDGKDYYELLVKDETGSDRTILELQALTISQINEDLRNMQNTLDTYETQTETFDTSNILPDSNPTSILTTLKNQISPHFPTPPEVDISIKYVEESMEDYLSPAFYLIPAIDNSNENVIYINPQHMNDDITLLTTLAHEGYPGHLYQSTYFSSTNPYPLRHLLGCDGYTEGWATYCEMMSYYFAPISKAGATVMQKNASIMLGLYALADMGIHYEGWTLADTIDFFREYGIYDTNAIKEIFNLIIGDPANYLKYYIGYVEFLELKKDAISAWGNEFTQKRFHREVLETGPVPFDILRENLKITN